MFVRACFLIFCALYGAGFGLTNAHATHDLINLSSKTSTVLTTGQIFDKANRPIPYATFVQRLAGADYVILGEYHDSVSQHHLADQLLQDLHRQRPQGSLLLEMLTVDQQVAIDKARQNPPSFKKLPKALGWQKSWDWALYGQIVAQPFEFGYPLIATNLTKSEVKTLMQGAEPLKGYLSTNDDIKAILKTRILKAHGFDKAGLDKADEKIVDNMVTIQQFRDRRMAEKILSSPKPTLLLTGNYHAEQGVGIPMHLIDLQHGKTPLTGIVVLMSKSMGEFDGQDADYIWVIQE
ncbi:ChaN family lipoprotein [Moraxella equi]|uniref:Uncharacterized iron-regulated protein n=1 Tax=Moraxella equi TaxID=60442 RepID=A0A378QLS2_9GAMM|nr:ChaN family lipoprotein [Moraxella equi]OPH38640.1 hypothetical protein B5J93_05655 [Moraxella equi]STZ01836.1 Uncharacterized iron-regulated protein [Moraxella equi]